ncbi:MAG: pyroglutamyl-peptidase I [Clostridia bacterium]|nr:pyroglutamyl-peptidase I [Clostridia bacterium]
MEAGKTRILLTAFDPFGGDETNASMLCAQAVKAPKGAELFVREMPTVFRRCRERMNALIDEMRPDVILCLGQAAGRRGVTIERIAVNLMDARIADNEGFCPRDLPIAPGGPDGLFATAPVRGMLDAVRARGIEASLSLSAGAFVCNCLLYETLSLIRERALPIRAGFVHIPTLLEQGKDGGGMPLSTAAEAVGLCLEACIS